MKIGIDVSSLVFQRGVSRYTSNLVRALLQEKDVNLRLYGSSLRQRSELENQLQPFIKQGAKAYLQSYPPSALQWLWRLGLNPLTKLLPAIDVFHSWDWLQPPDHQIPLVSTVHDLAMLKFPETAHASILQAHRRSWQILKDRQAQIIAVSQATKRDIVELLDIEPQNVTVINEALPFETIELNRNMTEENHQFLKTKLGLHSPYILFVGTREPRKNLSRLIEAWRPLSKSYQLIVAGAQGWDESENYGARLDNLRFLGHVSDAELSVLYSEAELLAYPSLYEGFGLPILEAFHHGTPVVTANVSALPEVAGNAAEYIDPFSIEDIRRGIEKVLAESVTAQQERLQKMIIRLHLFSWHQVAASTLHVYQRAIAHNQ